MSFYTNDWRYPEFAENLINDCRRLCLDYHIIEKPTTGSYYHNCRLKPKYILDCLKKFQRPLTWVDADGSLIKYPDILLEKFIDFDIAANKKSWDREQWHVNSIWFNFTEPTVEFVNEWCESSAIDDGGFQSTYKILKDQIKVLELPDETHTMKIKNTDVTENTCFLHRLSTSEIKLYEKQVSKKINKEKLISKKL